MRDHNLIIYASNDALPTDNATAFFHDTIKNHLEHHFLVMPPPLQPRIIPTSGQSEEQANFYWLPWKLVSIGYRKSYHDNGTYHTISNSMVAYHQMTWHNMFSGAWGTSRDLTRLQNVDPRPLILIGTLHFLV